MANRIVMADVAWSDCQIAPMRLSMAQEQMVTQSQYFTAAGELQQAFFRASIEYQITCLFLPAFFALGHRRFRLKGVFLAVVPVRISPNSRGYVQRWREQRSSAADKNELQPRSRTKPPQLKPI
jgi:hypothetical protein